ncbi:hypothetical protein GCM10027290_18630 [Micromonospora sonneratiae]
MCHAYGRANDVPNLLQQLTGGDAEIVRMTLRELYGSVRHQGQTTAAGALAVPFLLRMAADPTVHHRDELLRLAADIARRNYWGREGRTELLLVTDPEPRFDVSGYLANWSIEASRNAIAAHAASLIGLLRDPDPRVRGRAAYALAAALPGGDAITDALRARLSAETDATLQIGLVLAVAQHARELTQTDTALEWTRTLWSDPTQPAGVRLGAVIAWPCLTTAPPPPALVDAVTDLATPEMYDALHDVPWALHLDNPRGLKAWFTILLHDTSDGAAPPQGVWGNDDPWADLES